MENNKVADFYNPFYSKKENLVINERIYNLYKRVKKAGIHSSSSVIELGCGAGALTFLLRKVVKKGIIEAVDISFAAIAIARNNCHLKNVYFSQGDILTFTPTKIVRADFIILFDVLEHIPLDQHDNLFGHISSLMDENGTLLINIPNPRHIEYDSLHNPSALQIIDQPIALQHIVSLLSKHELFIIFMEIYGIWNVADYQFFIIKKDKPYKPVRLKQINSTYDRIQKKCERMVVKLLHPYPTK